MEGGDGGGKRQDADAVARLKRQLDVAQQITHIGSWEWNAATGAVTWSDELYRIYGIEPRSREITLDWFLSRVHPDDRDRVRENVAAAMQRGGRFAHCERIIRPDGVIRDLDTVGEVLTDAGGRPAGLIGTCRDVTDERRRDEILSRAQRMQAGERRALEMLAAGAPLEEILSVMALVIEELSPGTIASIVMLDATGTRLRHGAAPTLPTEYTKMVDGLAIGPIAGSCGTAAFRGEPVFVSDIATDPLWADYRHLALPHGLRACWSSPILANDGRVLGTFAVYYREVREPDEAARELIARAAHVAGIAIERRRLDEELRALSQRIEDIREDERSGISREIHDALGQALTALKLDIAWIARRSQAAGEVSDKLRDMARAADEIIHDVRRISAELRPNLLDDVGLQAAIEWQADEFARRTGLRCEVVSALGDVHLDRALATAVFRIFQEALTNVTRHASAKAVAISLRLERGCVVLDVADDGVGLPAPAPRAGSLGLLGMRERALRLGGRCVIASGVDGGTHVSLSLPLRFPAERAIA